MIFEAISGDKMAVLVGGFSPTHLKNMLVKMGSSSPNRSENKTCLKPPPSISMVVQHHHLITNSLFPKNSLPSGIRWSL